jgi:hypothetical protein
LKKFFVFPFQETILAYPKNYHHHHHHQPKPDSTEPTKPSSYHFDSDHYSSDEFTNTDDEQRPNKTLSILEYKIKTNYIKANGDLRGKRIGLGPKKSKPV